MTEFTRKTSFPTMPTGAPVRFVHAFTTDSGSNYHLHLNNYVEIYISGSGAAEYVVENRFYPLEPDDIIVITPLEVHKVVLHGDAVPYERFYFWFRRSFFRHGIPRAARILHREAQRSDAHSPAGGGAHGDAGAAAPAERAVRRPG